MVAVKAFKRFSLAFATFTPNAATNGLVFGLRAWWVSGVKSLVLVLVLVVASVPTLVSVCPVLVASMVINSTASTIINIDAVTAMITVISGAVVVILIIILPLVVVFVYWGCGLVLDDRWRLVGAVIVAVIAVFFNHAGVLIGDINRLAAFVSIGISGAGTQCQQETSK